MTKIAAFGTTFDVGTRQVETAVIVGTITSSGNATVTSTGATLVGSPLATSVAVLENDTADTVATKMATALNLVAAITDKYNVVANGSNLIYTVLEPAANDATLNIAYTNDTCAGLTPDATSNNTTAGVAYAEIAYVQSISGPSLSVDMEDVTTHDSTSGWEEQVPTIIRSGELTLELVYDPNNATQSFDDTDGLGERMESQKLTRCQLTFPGPYVWTFSAYITAFEPSASVDSALTASVSLKITDAPTLV